MGIVRNYQALLVGLLFLLGGQAGLAMAQDAEPDLPAVFDGVDVQEQLGEYLDPNLTFTNAAGQTVTLGDYLDGETPLILNFVYHNCPMLCHVVLDGLTASLREMEWVPGEQFEVLTISFNHEETFEVAARQKARYLRDLGKPEAEAGWHFLTGTEADITALTQGVGYSFAWVEATQEYAHPSVLVFVGGDGKITRYLHGIDYHPRNVRTALVEASEGTVGTTLDKLILYCYQYDPSANSYVLHATNIMKASGVLTLIALGLTLFIFWRREGARLDNLGLDT